MPPGFIERLGEGALIFDGGMGTSLYERGVFINRSFDELNLSNPALVRDIHAAFVRAGADIIETNTFGANRVKLTPHGVADKIREINLQGVKIARQAAGDKVLVAGSIGPLGIKIEPWGPTSVEEAKAHFKEQALALAEAGIDLYVIETFADINEIHQAILAAREAAPELPVMAQMTLGEDGSSLYGTAPETFAQRLESWGADVIGVNCSVGPAIMLEAVERMAAVAHRKISAQPNAGMPRSVEGRNIYLCSPEYMASYARRFLEAGASIVGGCCGTTPDHVHAIARAVRAAAPRKTVHALAVPQEVRSAAPTVARANKSGLSGKLAQGRFIRAAEVLPPKGFDTDKVLAGAQKLKDSGIDLVTIPDVPRGSARMSPQALALILETKLGLETLVHYSCRDRNLLGMQSDLLGHYALGLRNILCITGDRPKVGDYPDATAVFDVDSIGLTNMVRCLNQGVDVGGNPVGRPTGFYIGVTLNPTAVNLDEEVRRFEWKVEAGAEFCLAPFVYDVALLEAFMKRVAPSRIPVIAALWPLGSYENAEFLNNEVPGCHVPDKLLERMRAAAGQSRAAERAEGIRIAQETLAAVAPLVQGAQIAAAFGHYEVVQEVYSVLAGA